MRYQSTRGGVSGLSFREAVLMGLADDGGLLLPESLPELTPGDLESLYRLDYPELAFQIISHFVDDIPSADLSRLINRSYTSFTHPDVTPLVHRDGVYILELFHGPTLAFKDVALQLLGNLFEYLLEQSGQTMNIIGATSGDTGSAAIHGVRGKKNINIFILHPQGRVSPVQELQMTTVTDDNVFNLAVDGTFDDAQAIVKEIFGDVAFKKRLNLGAINSINWARVLAQVVYYFYAFGRLRRETGCEKAYFSVPTGNFGDIFAGYIARSMGLPIHKLILATNENNILSRFVEQGDYSLGSVVNTLSPSMDIQVASNFERYLFCLLKRDPEAVTKAMADFKKDGRLHFSPEQIARVQQDFLAQSVDRDQTLATIREFHANTGYVLDPHSAVGVSAGRSRTGGEYPVICLATAHPAKFKDAVQQAIGCDPDRPPSLQGLEQREKRCLTLPAEITAVREFVEQHAC